MATTWPGSIKELLAGIGDLGGRVFRDGEDLDGVVLPYVTVIDPISEVPTLRGDASTLARFRDEQVDLWQERAAYDEALVNAVRDALDGAKAMGARLTVLQTVLVPEPLDEGQTHHSLTVRASAHV